MSEEILVLDACLGLRVLRLVEVSPSWVSLTALDDPGEKVIVFLPHSPLAEIVPLMLVQTGAGVWAADVVLERILTSCLVVLR